MSMIASGHLDVGDGHSLYWEEWGNPAGVPVVCLHGGPGAAFNDSHKALFDPAVHRVLFHDQRGCGRSTPLASLEHNTTADLVADVDRLMTHRGFESAHVAGGSWGSTLSLFFALAHPARVRSLLLWAVWLTRREENDWVASGGPRRHFPREWERFISLVPESSRGSGQAITSYYADRIAGHDLRHAREWTLWELSLCSLDYDPERLEREVAADPNTLASAAIETHFLRHGCFVSENHILDSIAAIRDIPCTVVQGRFDMCTPPATAYDLAAAYGPALTLQVVNAGHLRTEPALRAALTAAALGLDGVG